MRRILASNYSGSSIFNIGGVLDPFAGMSDNPNNNALRVQLKVLKNLLVKYSRKHK